MRGVPRLVWLATALHVLLLLSWSVLAPTYHAPDEPQHVDAAVQLADGDGWPRPGRLGLSESVANSLPAAGFAPVAAPPRPERVPAEAAADQPRPQRPTYEELGDSRDTAKPNQMTQHPPLYYGLGAAVLRVVPGADDGPFDRTVGVLRLLSVLLSAPLPLLAYLAGRRLLGEGAASAAAVGVLAVPELTHIGSSVTNDSLLTLVFAGLTLVVVRIATGDLSRRTALVGGLLTGAALLTKGFALVVPAWLLLAYVVGGRHAARDAVRSGALALGSGAALGGWWWVTNLVRYGAVQPQGQPGPPERPGFDASPVDFLRELVGGLSRRFWGDFGWYEAPLPRVVAPVATVALVLLVARGVLALRARLGTAVLLLAPTVLIAAIVTANAWQTYRGTGLALGIQGRYLFPGLVGLTVLAATGVREPAGRGARWLPAGAVVVALGAQLLGVLTMLRHFWGPGGGPDRLARLLDDAPWPAILVSTVLVATGVLAAWLSVTAVGYARGSASADSMT